MIILCRNVLDGKFFISINVESIDMNVLLKSNYGNVYILFTTEMFSFAANEIKRKLGDIILFSASRTGEYLNFC